MAGARGHRVGTIYSRMRGLLKTEVLPWHKRPVWYDVWEAFPPNVQPEFTRPLPEQTLAEIVYPEDFVRAKFFDTYNARESVNMKKIGAKTDAQLFIETYIRLQTPGATVEEVLQKTEKFLENRGKQYRRKIPLKTKAEDQTEESPPEGAGPDVTKGL